MALSQYLPISEFQSNTLLLQVAVAEVCLEEVAVVLEVIEIVRLGKQQAVAVLLKVRFRLRLVPTQ